MMYFSEIKANLAKGEVFSRQVILVVRCKNE